MPIKPQRPCRYPGCPNLTGDKSGYCPEHLTKMKQQLKQTKREHDRQRGSAASRGYDWRWQKASKLYLANHPLCAECQRQGRVKVAALVDHIEPHRGDYGLFWDYSNWQSLCKECHNIKTASEDGAFGNPVKK